MKAGDLVKYQPSPWHPKTCGVRVGLVLAVNDNYPGESCPVRVKWVVHLNSERDWYARDELAMVKNK